MFGRKGTQVVKTFGKKTAGVGVRKITSADDSFDARLASAKKKVSTVHDQDMRYEARMPT